MKVVVIQTKLGEIISMNLSVDGAAHFLSTHGSSPKIEEKSLTIDCLEDALDRGSLAVSYSDEEDVMVSVHVASV